MLSPNIRCSKNTGQNSVTCRSAEWSTKGVATGCIYIYIYTPPKKKSVTVLFTCETLTHVLKLQRLIYPPKSNSWLRHCGVLAT